MIKFGLIGVGGIGAYHRAAIEKLERRGVARLVAVADPTVDRLSKEKEELDGRGVNWHLDYRDMLREDLDAVAIATPIPFHFEMALACIKRGVLVNLEKPPVPFLSQLDTLIAADAGNRVYVGFQMIGSRCIQTLKLLIAEGRLGELLEIRTGACWPRLDHYYNRASWAGRMTLKGLPVFDGPATNGLAHLIHNIMFLGAEGLHSYAMPAEVRGELYRARPIESYDTACLNGRFASGVRFSVAVTHASRESLPFQIEVRGTGGWARISNDGATLETSCGVACNHQETTQQLINTFYANLTDKAEGPANFLTPSLSDTRGYVASTNAMFRSAGGIRDIESAETYGTGDNQGYHVPGLMAAIEESLASGKLFSEQGLSWATARPQTVALQGFSGISLEDLEAGSANSSHADAEHTEKMANA